MAMLRSCFLVQVAWQREVTDAFEPPSGTDLLHDRPYQMLGFDNRGREYGTKPNEIQFVKET